MIADDREQLRLSLLCQLGRRAWRYGLPIGVLHRLLRADGFNIEREAAEAEVLYLADKGLVEMVPKPISPEVTAWRITAAGRDHLAERGLG